MCQLIFSNLKSVSLNRLAIHMLAHKGSGQNGDGFGIYTPTVGLWKSEFSAESILDMGRVLREIITDTKPVLAHVRAASPGIVVKKENAHPFEGTRFILAHNGRLWGKSEEVTRVQANQADTSIGSDSEKFLQKLEELSVEFPEYSAPMLVNKAMENFKGKFAFLIYDKVTNKFFAVRGKTADLHYSMVYEGFPPEKDKPNECKLVGYLVMTKASDLEEFGYLICTLAGTTLGTQLWLTKAIPFNEETAYELKTSSPVEVASVKENPTYTPTVIYTSRGGNHYETSGNSHSTKKDKLALLCEEISVWAEETYLDIVAVDELFMNIFGTGIADATENSLKIFVERFMPSLRGTKKQRKMMSKSGIVIFPHRVLCPLVPGLQFPWTLTTNNGTLAKAIEIWQKEIKK